MGKTRKPSHQSGRKETETILDVAHHYMTEKSHTSPELDPTNLNDASQKRKATEADQERKREKNRLKRVKKKEMKIFQGKIMETQKDVLKTKAVEYLRNWESAPKVWTFKKKLQVWLLKNIYKDDQISKADFDILLKYLAGLKGLARWRLLKDAEDLVQKHDGEETESSIPEETYDRARQIAQAL